MACHACAASSSLPCCSRSCASEGPEPRPFDCPFAGSCGRRRSANRPGKSNVTVLHLDFRFDFQILMPMHSTRTLSHTPVAACRSPKFVPPDGLLPKENAPLNRVGHCEGNSEGLEEGLQSELEYSGVKRGLDLSEVACPEVVADAAVVDVTFELRVIPNVEALCSELDLESLCEDEVLQQCQAPVVAPWSSNRVKPEVAIAIRPRGAGRCSEGRRIEPLGHGMRSGNRPCHLWPVSTVENDAAGVASVHSEIDWSARFRRDDSRKLPSTQVAFNKWLSASLKNGIW